MDRSLDEIIAERPVSPQPPQLSSLFNVADNEQRQNRGQNKGPRNQGRRSNGVKKPYRDERVDLDLDWVHDKYEDDRDTRPSRGGRRARVDRYSPSPDRASAGTRLRIENLHYDITETDLEELFSRIGSISNVSLVYDRAGRSEGVAYVTYNRHSDAKTAIAEFDGANAKGQPIRISITSSGPRRDRNPFDTAEKPRGSLFDRVERPRDARTSSPEGRSESAEGAGRRRRRRGGGNYRRSDVSKPAPDHIDRYVPGQQAPARRTGGGRRQGGEVRRGGNPRPKKTQEELDQEMEDYWGSNAGAGTTDQAAAPEQTAAEPAPAAVAPAAAAPAVDDDIDMIE